MDSSHVEHDLVNVLFTEEQIQQRLAEMAAEITADYEGRDLLVVGVLRGAVMVMADLSRSMPRHLEMDWMAVSSYGSGTKSSGVVRILKDLDTDISGRDVLIVDEIIDTGLTLSWLVNNLSSRPQATTIRVPDEFKGAQLADLFGGNGFPKVSDDGTITLTLGSRDFFWLRLVPGAARG